jgi:NAD(P)-dependent dehydrogenase (short-subunit alcohol dehydrogenase family)
VISCAGNAAFRPFADLTDADYALGLRSKLMGQVTLARIAKDHLRDGGSITLTTGILAMHPMPGSASISMVNAGLEGFVRAAALEMPRNLRVNAVSPPWVKETMVKLGMDRRPALPRRRWRRRMWPRSRARNRGLSSTLANSENSRRPGARAN